MPGSSIGMTDKDNRDDSRLRPKRVIAVISRVWLKRVFSRSDPQEPKKGLPGQTGENPAAAFEKRQAGGCAEQFCRDRTTTHPGILSWLVIGRKWLFYCRDRIHKGFRVLSRQQ